jgi:hypothetical protein
LCRIDYGYEQKLHLFVRGFLIIILDNSRPTIIAVCTNYQMFMRSVRVCTTPSLHVHDIEQLLVYQSMNQDKHN